MRVPLTNNAQLVDFKPTANYELRMWDFVADSPILDLSVSSSSQVQLCLYAPTNQTYEVLTTSSLFPGFAWQSCGTAMMTNAFHIFLQGPAVDPARFYRWKQF